MRTFTTIILSICLAFSALSQNAELRGHVYDAENQPLPSAVVQLTKANKILYLVETDQVGSFQIKGIEPGNYELNVNTFLTEDTYQEQIRFSGGQIQLRDSIILSNEGHKLGPIIIRRTINSEEPDELEGETIRKLPGQDPSSTLVLQPRVEIRDGRLEVGKGKSGSTQVLMGGNIAAIGPLPISNFGLEHVQVIDLAVAARYGGFTGGAVSFKTMPISLENRQSIQAQTSSPFNAFHHNLFSYYFSRAVKTETLFDSSFVDEGGKLREKSRLIFGYSFTGNYKFQKDVNPAYQGYMVGKEPTLYDLQNNPLVSSEVQGGFVPAATFLSSDDVEYSAIRQNAERHDVSGQLKFSWNPKQTLQFDLINTYNFVYRRLPLANNILLNSNQNPLQTNHFTNTQFSMSHRLKSPYSAFGTLMQDSTDFISDLSYTIEINHQYSETSTSSYQHRDHLFNYGYVGEFNSLRVPVYTYQQNKPLEYDKADGTKGQVSDYWELTGFKDSLVGFNPGSQNPELAAYTRFIYNTLGGEITRQNLIQRGGIMNGQNLPLLNSLYANPGTTYGSYGKSYQERFGITAYTEAAFHPFRNSKLQHDIEFGLTYQQDRYGYYNVNAAGLWQLMPLLANQHITELKRDNPILSRDEFGRFLDSVTYDVLVDKSTQKNFDRNLRAALIASGYTDQDGNPIREDSWIDVNALNPNTYNINMFSADELLNNGDGFISYSGYKYNGEKSRGKQGITSFLNDPLNRPNDGFNPITAALWVQDKFVFRNLIMRAGFRFERYDANQSVLKDPFVIYPVRQVGEVNNLNGVPVSHPGSVDNNYVVYVNDAANPTSIVGYRKADQWFDKSGNRVNDPSLLANASNSGRIQPMLVDPNNQQLSASSFTKYSPQNLVLPRISFSFPITRESLVYVSYDKLAQNPDPALIYLPFTTYYFMQSNISNIIPNPELKARLKTEYNIGIKQHLGQFASINLTASYATIRNDFNQYRLEGAYPYSYTTYSNIDFSAIKRYITEYEYINQHISLSASYSLQFADGTGSNINSASALIQSGQPNLRSLFPLSFDNRHSLKGYFIYSFGRDDKDRKTHYSGPSFGTHQILKDAFISFTLQSVSGFPYSATQQPVSEAQSSNGVVQRAQLKGNPFGNRMVWRNMTDLRIEKAFAGNQNHSISAYLVVSNLLNLKIVESVYSFTGLADDDGYLNSPQGQQQVRNQINAETFNLLYQMRLNNQNNFGAPRNVQIGVRVDL